MSEVVIRNIYGHHSAIKKCISCFDYNKSCLGYFITNDFDCNRSRIKLKILGDSINFSQSIKAEFHRTKPASGPKFRITGTWKEFYLRYL